MKQTLLIFFVDLNQRTLKLSPRTIFTVFNNNITFIIDSGASCSVIDSKFIPKGVQINTNDIISIKGINGITKSLGSIDTSLHFGNDHFNIKFNVVSNLPSNIAGLVGTDFLVNYKANIDFETLILTLKSSKCIIHKIPVMIDGTVSIVIPPRTEVTSCIRTKFKDTCVVLNQEVAPHVFIANSIGQPLNGMIPVRIVNFRNKPVAIDHFEPHIELASNYHVIELCKKGDNIDKIRASKLLKELKLNHLAGSDMKTIKQICLKYADIFCLEGDKLETTNVYCPTVTVKPNSQPLFSKPYRLPHSQRNEVCRQVRKMLEDEIIEETKSEWNSPLLLVPKKSDTNEKKWRLVIDYRKVNTTLQDDKFPLPNIEEVIDSLAGAQYFTHLDLSQGYYQCKLNPGDRPITAFSTPSGQYQMTRLPMGLKISPSSFSRLMTVAMSGLNLERCLVYLDDIIVFGKTFDEHNKNLISIFQRLRDVNLKLNPSKCNFLKQELLYLGHYISKEGVLPDPSKIEIIKNWKSPVTPDEVKRFVAFANYYRKHIRDFAKICAPLNYLTRKDVVFNWTAECEAAFQKMKGLFVKPPVLDYPNFDEENIFKLHTDASGYGLGAVLSNMNDRPIAFTSKMLNKAEKNYSTIEKELLAMVWAIRHFRSYLHGRKFQLYTDHRPLVYLFTLTDPSSRLTKFRLALEEYDFDVIYKKGSENVVADALSRISATELKDIHNKITSEAFITTRMQTRCSTSSESREVVTGHDSSSINPIQVIVRENNFKENVKWIPDKEMIMIKPTETLDSLRRTMEELGKICRKYKVDELYMKMNDQCAHKFYEKIVNNNLQKGIPKIIRISNKIKVIEDDLTKKLILNDYHLLPTAGHAGIKRTMSTIKQKYYWKGMKRDVEELVKSCEKCQKYKTINMPKTEITITTTAGTAFEKIYLDLVGPLIPSEGNEYILTTQCELTKFITATPIKNKATNTVAKAFVENFILKYGVPERIASDRGTEFMSELFSSVAKLLHIEKLNSTAYYHQAIGALENTHKSLGNFLRIQCDSKLFSWTNWVPYYEFAYNNTIHTKTNYTPFHLVYGKLSKMPSNLTDVEPEPMYNIDDYCKQLKSKLQISHHEVRNRLIEEKSKRVSETNKKAKLQLYKSGDLVWLKNETAKKLEAKYNGPYKILEDMNPNVKILINKKEDLIHKSRIKPYEGIVED